MTGSENRARARELQCRADLWAAIADILNNLNEAILRDLFDAWKAEKAEEVARRAAAQEDDE